VGQPKHQKRLLRNKKWNENLTSRVTPRQTVRGRDLGYGEASNGKKNYLTLRQVAFAVKTKGPKLTCSGCRPFTRKVQTDRTGNWGSKRDRRSNGVKKGPTCARGVFKRRNPGTFLTKKIRKPQARKTRQPRTEALFRTIRKREKGKRGGTKERKGIQEKKAESAESGKRRPGQSREGGTQPGAKL